MSRNIFFSFVFLCGCKLSSQESPKQIQFVPVVMEIQIVDQAAGTGATVSPGDEVSISFRVWAYDPNKADGKSVLIEDVPATKPLALKVGSNKLFPDFEKSLIGMKPGGKRLILLPPSSAYGTIDTNPSVKPSTPLLIEAELLKINRK